MDFHSWRANDNFLEFSIAAGDLLPQMYSGRGHKSVAGEGVNCKSLECFEIQMRRSEIPCPQQSWSGNKMWNSLLIRERACLNTCNPGN